MQTNDTSFATYLIRRGFEMSCAIDYSQPKWCYEFVATDDEWHEELRLFRELKINQIIRIHQALVNAGKGREVHVKTLADWPELRWAVDGGSIARDLGNRTTNTQKAEENC